MPGDLVKYTLLLVCLSLTACAGPFTKTSQDRRQCDETADQAVARGDWPAALKEHERVLAAAPDHCLVMYHLGYIWGQLQDRRLEIHYYQKALSCGYQDDDQIHLNLGMAYFDLGEFENASRHVGKAVAANPDSADNLFGLGVVSLAAGQADAAEKAWLDSVLKDPNHLQARLSLVRLYLNQSRWQAARDQLDAVNARDPSNAEAEDLRLVLEARERIEY
ncbi:MAG: tetratricopeptide repeat protein [Desulfatitalea sp.]|nr:tetratricopeptide repeat protein [Desulfatitalea sp.]NNK01814.1 tetratricopeptide repeat protein [Desulfatitalea sp.]